MEQITYNLNLTKDYCSHWGLKEALRELVANTIDEKGRISYHETSDLTDEPTVQFTTYSELPIEAFLMGYSVKNNDSIGQYGEGLKLAMLVCTRLDMPMYFKSGEFAYQFFFLTPIGFGVETLHVMRMPADPSLFNSYPTTETNIIISNVDKSLMDKVYIDAPINSAVPNKIGFYCQGLLVESNFYIKVKGILYGINLGTSIKSNRDRNYFPNKELATPIIEKMFSPEDMLTLDTSWYMSDLYRSLSPSFKLEVAKVYLLQKMPIYTKADLENIRVLIPDYHGRRHSRQAGYIVAPAWSYGNYLMSEEDAAVLRKLVIKDTDIAIEQKNDELLKKRLIKMLKDCELSANIYELLESVCNYIPALRDYTEFFRDSVITMAEQILDKRQPTADYSDLIDEDDIEDIEDDNNYDEDQS